MNVLQLPLMNEKEIQTDDENIHNQLVNLINSMLFHQRWLNKKGKVNTLRNLLKNSCYISMFNKLLLTMIETPKTLLLQSFTLLSSSSSSSSAAAAAAAATASSSSSSSAAAAAATASSSSISNDLFIIGAGQMRTGTTSLKFALQLLYNQSCYHMYDIIYHYQESHIQKWLNLFNMNKNFINIEKIYWNDIFNECRFAVDYPTCVFYKELMKIYPNAKKGCFLRDGAADPTLNSHSLPGFGTNSNFRRAIGSLCSSTRGSRRNYGLDWSSKLRYIEAYKDEDRRDENIWPEHSSHLRTYPKLKCHGMSPEWSIYTNGYTTGKKCLFDGIHQRSIYCTSEYILHDGFTHKRRI
ncbi:unnamed protein product [Schistosoma rodhaini]|uniref:Sulfotransferase domain-containing protein n=1 Tax=Schistosoma rodhaini TaxID=6188 RepID=A0AA85FBZ4_9TREM|nr:unnamed protein product [Schistosoma rodhaini]